MYDDILVPTDGGERMGAVTERAVDIAAQRGATVHALSVIDSEVFLTLDEGLTDAVEGELETNANRAVEAVSDAAAEAGVESSVAVRDGRPGEEILAYAEEIGADLLVMGTRSKNGHERRMLGSVAQDVVSEATQPTLVVPLDSA
jgi:nucleotide-binding universal stress UspA family protein